MLAEDIGVEAVSERAPGAIVLAAILASPLDVVAQRVRDEVVELSNGDRVTGEIKGLDRSQLTVRTLDLGTVQIRWQRVVRLNSNRMLEIELADGRRLQGSLVSPMPGTLDVSGSAGTVRVDIASIVVIRPVSRSWIGDLTGRFDAGFSYTRGSRVAQTSASAEITTRRPAFESTVTFNAVLTKVDGQADSSRYLLGYSISLLDRTRVRRGPWRCPAQPGPWHFIPRVGWGRTRLSDAEEPATGADGPGRAGSCPGNATGGTPDNARLVFAATNYSLFVNEYPKTNLDVANQLRFGLSEPGRFLLDLNVSVRRELWRDFYIAGSLYHTYRLRPPASSTIKNDVGVTLTLGWTF